MNLITQATALIIDDEPDILALLQMTLERMNVATKTASDLKQAYQLLQHNSFDLCLTDMRLPDGNGLELVEYIQQYHPKLPVAMITAHGTMETAIQALKLGAYDFVSKPIDLKNLRELVQTGLKLSPFAPHKERRSRYDLLGDSKAMQQIRTMIAKLARSQAPVFISGESGTGKELAARLIHQMSPRSDQAFIAVNCGAIPEELLESELFGYKKGSFTGAHADKDGLFKMADNGTLFLDEIADLPLNMQVKLLRAIQDKKIRPIGGKQEIAVNIRIISATHKDLAQLVQQEGFRHDLYFRINVIELVMPSLREHPEDIPLLIEHIIYKLSPNHLINLTPAALKSLQNYSFPGNVRELENIIERALALCDNQTITPEILSLKEPLLTNIKTSKAIPNANQPPPQTKSEILLALEQHHWNQTATAKALGLTLRQLRYRIQKLELKK